VSRRRKKELQRLREKLEKTEGELTNALSLLGPAARMISIYGGVCYQHGWLEREVDVRHWQLQVLDTYGQRY
jgi:hypothetical protein